MDPWNYFESLGQEGDSLKQRVRHLLADRHWQTDGEWKESVVRQVLRRHLPATALVGRGYRAPTRADTAVRPYLSGE